MPIYEFKCEKCHKVEEFFHSMDEIVNVSHTCLECNEVMRRIFCTNFNMKDGMTGTTPSKANREKKYRQRRSEVLKKKQSENHAPPRLVPNVQNKEGKPELFDSWKEASKYAKSEGKSEKSYESLVEIEKSK